MDSSGRCHARGPSPAGGVRETRGGGAQAGDGFTFKLIEAEAMRRTGTDGAPAKVNLQNAKAEFRAPDGVARQRELIDQATRALPGTAAWAGETASLAVVATATPQP